MGSPKMWKTNRTEISLVVFEYLKEELKSKGFSWPLESPVINENEPVLGSNKRRQVVEALCKLSHSISTSFNDNLNQVGFLFKGLLILRFHNYETVYFTVSKIIIFLLAIRCA